MSVVTMYSARDIGSRVTGIVDSAGGWVGDPLMRKSIFAMSSLLFFCTGWVFGQQSAWNGTGWKTLSSFDRAVFVMGFNKGHVAGMRDGVREVIEAVTSVRPASLWTLQEKQKLAEKTKQLDQKFVANSDFTIGQIEATVSTFYEDYRNMPVCLDDAVLFSTASLRGKAPAEEELIAARRDGSEIGCK
jgi:hypothetical protein